MDVSPAPFARAANYRIETAGTSPFDLASMVRLTPAPATLATSADRADWGDVKVHRLDLAHGAHLRVAAAADTCLWGLILYRSAPVTISGSMWNPQEIVVLRGGDFELCANGPAALVLIEAPEREVPCEIDDDPAPVREPAFLSCGPSTIGRDDRRAPKPFAHFSPENASLRGGSPAGRRLPRAHRPRATRGSVHVGAR
jgi:hypothetical protein